MYSGQWLEFEDFNGLGFAQPDYFILDDARLVLLECKLSQTKRAWPQLNGLYAPLLQHIFDLPVTSIQVCKNLYEDDGSIIAGFDEIYTGATWHWIGG